MYNPTAEAKVKNICIHGVNKLHVVMDFDKTITHSDSLTSFRIIETSKLVSDKYQQKVKELFDYYNPIELDLSLPYIERFNHMNDWLFKSRDLFIDEGLNCSRISDIIYEQKHNVFFKKGVKNLFKLCHANSIPVLILSAGLGDVIKPILKQKRCNYKNIHIISNFFCLEDHAKKSEYISVYTKNTGPILKSKYAKQIIDRPNVLVIGDSLGDANMIDNIHSEIALKIGFVTNPINLDIYNKCFDIALVKCDNFDLICKIIHDIISADNTTVIKV